jgi:hypothetical protein
MNKDLYNILNAKFSIPPAAKTAAVTGSGVDLAGYEGATIFGLAGNWTDGSFPFALQESDDNSTYTAVADKDIVGDQPTISCRQQRFINSGTSEPSNTSGPIRPMPRAPGQPVLSSERSSSADSSGTNRRIKR